MFRVILCDEDKSKREILKRHIEEFFLDKEEVKIICCKNEYEIEEIIKKHHSEYLTVKKGRCLERIPIKTIKYLISDKRKLRIIKTGFDQSIEFYMKMREAEEELKSAGFIRCHQSYLVNIEQIIRVEGKALLIDGDERIPLSRKYRKEVVRRLESKNDRN